MPIGVPKGFRFAGVNCGLKKKQPDKLDFSLVVSDVPATAAGVYTRNLVFAAPVGFDRQRTPGHGFRVVAINSGNANACTGPRGDADAARMAELAASAVGAGVNQALVLSTGVIGEFMPMDKIAVGISTAAAALGADEESFLSAARGIMTTDTVHKTSGRTLSFGGRTVQIAGLCKGAAMIGPNMATMLAVLLTDAALEPSVAQSSLKAAVDESFNCLSVEGHMSTNDTVLLIANGASGGSALSGDDLVAFQRALGEVCAELAMAIAADGEGCSHLVTIDVRGCATREHARRIAKSVAESVLVKTALAGADPNWGRIVSAAGYAGVGFDPGGVSLRLNGLLVFDRGAPANYNEREASDSLRANRDTSIELTFSEGTASVRFWTTDLTAEYVRLNADYRT